MFGLPAPSVTDVALTAVAIASLVVAALARKDTKVQAQQSKIVADSTIEALNYQKKEFRLHEEESKRGNVRFLPKSSWIILRV